MFQVGYRANCHDTLFQHLKNIMAKRFKRNVAKRFLCYMVEAYVSSRNMWQGDISKEGEIYPEAGLGAL